MSKTAQEIVTETAAWLRSNPDNHIKNAYAQDANGFRCAPTSDDAVCFCALGYMRKLAENKTTITLAKFLGTDINVFTDIIHANDKGDLNKTADLVEALL